MTLIRKILVILFSAWLSFIPTVSHGLAPESQVNANKPVLTPEDVATVGSLIAPFEFYRGPENQYAVNATLNKIQAEQSYQAAATGFPVDAVNDLLGKLLGGSPHPFLGIRVVDLAELKAFSIDGLHYPFIGDYKGYIYIPKALFASIIESPHSEEIIFEMAVHHTLKINAALKTRVAERLAQGMKAAPVVIYLYLDSVSNATAWAKLDSPGSFSVHGTTAMHHLALLAERYTRAVRVGYTTTDGKIPLGGPHPVHPMANIHFLTVTEGFENQGGQGVPCFLTVPGKLAEFLYSQEHIPPGRIGNAILEAKDVLPDFRTNSPGENGLYLAITVFPDTVATSPNTTGLLTNLLGDGVYKDRLAMGFIASVVARYARATGGFGREFLADVLASYRGQDLINILQGLNRLADKMNMRPPHSPRTPPEHVETAMMQSVLEVVFNSLDAGDPDKVRQAIDDLAFIYDIINRDMRYSHEPLLNMTHLFYMLRDFTIATGRLEMIAAIRSALEQKDTRAAMLLLDAARFPILKNKVDPWNPLVRGMAQTLHSRLLRIPALIQKMRERNIPTASFVKGFGIHSGAGIPDTFSRALLFELLDLVLHKSAVPVTEIEDLLPNLLENQKIDPLFPTPAFDQQRSVILQGVRELYDQGYGQIPEPLFRVRDRLPQGDAILQNSKDGIPPYRGRASWPDAEQDPEIIALLMYACRDLRSPPGDLLAFSKFEILLAQIDDALDSLDRPSDGGVPAKERTPLGDKKSQLFQIMARLYRTGTTPQDLDTLLGDLGLFVQRMDSNMVQRLLHTLDRKLNAGESLAALPDLFDALAYFASSLEFEEGRSTIASVVRRLEKASLPTVLAEALQQKIDLDQKRFPESPLEDILRNIRELNPSLPEPILTELLSDLQEVTGFQRELATLTKPKLKQRALAIREDVRAGRKTFAQVKTEYLAIARETAKRFKGLQAYHVQLAGVLLYHADAFSASKGLAQEVRTGEGKSLVIALSAALAALKGDPVDVITVNPYLARRDAESFQALYEHLGYSVDFIQEPDTAQSLPDANKKVFEADIVYGTNAHFQFLYLYELIGQYPIRAAWKHNVPAARDFAVAIVDEMDSLFLDEAMNPHLISGFGVPLPSWHYKPLFDFFSHLTEHLDFEDTEWTDAGRKKYHDFMTALYQTEEGKDKTPFTPLQLRRYARSGLLAIHRMKRDVDYVIANVEREEYDPQMGFVPRTVQDIVIIDLPTGRRRPQSVWPHGVHQFTQLKEGLEMREEFHPLVSMTNPYYFKKYRRIFAITGTIGTSTDRNEMKQLYGVQLLRMPPHKPSQRVDRPDLFWLNEKEKWNAVVRHIRSEHHTGRPVLVGVRTITDSNMLSERLTKEGIQHSVLNGEQKESETSIVHKAGLKGSVTIATNLAGRGTDILLGEGVEELGGLHVIGTERFGATRIDDQLRGRAGRQGLPGSSQFLLALNSDAFAEYLGEAYYALVEWWDRTQDLKRLPDALSEAQHHAEVKHYETRTMLYILHVAGDHAMEIFFDRLKRYFSVRNAMAMFPEMASHRRRPEDIHEGLNIFATHAELRERVFEYWTSHLQFLEDLAEEYREKGIRHLYSNLTEYYTLASENLETVLSRLREDAIREYLSESRLPEEEIRRRLAAFERTQEAPSLGIPESAMPGSPELASPGQSPAFQTVETSL